MTKPQGVIGFAILDFVGQSTRQDIRISGITRNLYVKKEVLDPASSQYLRSADDNETKRRSRHAYAVNEGQPDHQHMDREKLL